MTIMFAEARRRQSALGVCILFATATTLAQDSYRLDRASIDGSSGGFAANIDYELVVAIGQHDAGVVSSNVVYRFSGGVFARVPSDVLFKNEFEDN